jgi:hypothetical protein
MDSKPVSLLFSGALQNNFFFEFELICHEAARKNCVSTIKNFIFCILKLNRRYGTSMSKLRYAYLTLNFANADTLRSYDQEIFF